MSNSDDIVKTISSHYVVQVMRAFGNVDPGSKALEIVGKTLNEVYRYFEPSFFQGAFIVCKSFDDKPCYDEANGILLYDKNILLNRTNGILIIQAFDDPGKLILWENQDPNLVIGSKDTLVYYFENNHEYFFANESKIDITINNSGSRFANQFKELVDALQLYATNKIYKSTCKHFNDSWSDGNRLFFRGAGSGNNIPEKFMQLSLFEFLNSFLVRGISLESSREYNVIGDFSKPKPVDIRIHWREANRSALIEVKFIGTVKKDSDGEIYSHQDARANEGIIQLKGYYDSANTDNPTTIIKSFLVIIDGRRNNLSKELTAIKCADGMHFKDIEIQIDADKEFHKTVLGFEKPIRMFASPICY